MAKPASIIGVTFNELTVVRDSGVREHRKVIFECLCSCGNSINLRGASIVSGNTKTCGACKSSNKGTVSKVVKRVSSIIGNSICPLYAYYNEVLGSLPNHGASTITDGVLELLDHKLAIRIILNTAIPSSIKHNCEVYTKYRADGYRLITLYENEWVERQIQILNLVMSVLHQSGVTIFARKTLVCEVDKQETFAFLNTYHIQGKASAGIKSYGLRDKSTGTLIAVMTFNVHHRSGASDVAVLNRFAVRSLVSIPGGASKLLSHSIRALRCLGYTKIISWADLRYSYGNVYEKLGFALTETLPSDYSYYNTKTGKLESKQSNQKRLLGTPAGMTELQHTILLGKQRLYDCGKLRFELDI